MSSGITSSAGVRAFVLQFGERNELEIAAHFAAIFWIPRFGGQASGGRADSRRYLSYRIMKPWSRQPWKPEELN